MFCPYFFFFLSLFSFFLFLLVFSLTDTNDSQDSREGRGNYYFSRFPLPPAHEHSFSSSRFLPLHFSRSICNYQTDSYWDLFSLEICILFASTFTFQSDIVKIWVHIKLSLFHYKVNALSTEIETSSHYCLSITPTQLYLLAITYPLTV